jgi:anthranilate phosphoribosyltransferase
MTPQILEQLIAGRDLTQAEARALMNDIMDGTVGEATLAALLTALRIKGETVEEIAGFAAAMREHAVAVQPRRNSLVDTCGTGGDGKQTFNISTAAALVAAAMGIGVAKHGNRAISSRSGSADVLEALGVNITLPPAAVAELIDRVGIGFLFAPQHHPAMKFAAPVRRQLGVRTVFNVLGPLTNPAGVKRQLLGVFRPELTDVLCGVLRRLGAERAFVVHGCDGTDEVSIAAETRVSELKAGEVHTYHFAPEEAGLERAAPEAIAGGDAAYNAVRLRAILAGEPGPLADAVALNTAFVAMAADRAGNAAEGVSQARAMLASGRAVDLLEHLRRVSHELAAN